MPLNSTRLVVFTKDEIPVPNGVINRIVRRENGGIENDLKFSNFEDSLSVARSNEWSELCYISDDWESLDPKKILEYGLSLMKEEKYWLAHEYIEHLWKSSNRPASEFFHSVVMFCVSMVHHQMKRYGSDARLYGEAVMEYSKFFQVPEIFKSFSYPIPPGFLHLLYESSNIVQDSPGFQ